MATNETVVPAAGHASVDASADARGPDGSAQASPGDSRSARASGGPAAEADWPRVDRRVNETDRRKPTLKSFLQGALTPRRRQGRRASDHDFPIDWHDPYLMALAVAMLLLSLTDALMTVTLLNAGAVETNPLLALVVHEHPRIFAAGKMALTGAGIVILVAVAKRRLLGLVSARAVFQALVLAYLALIGYEIWLLRLAL